MMEGRMAGDTFDQILGITPVDELPEAFVRQLAREGDLAAQAELNKRRRVAALGPESVTGGPVDTLPEAALLTRALDGDEEAEAELIRRSPRA